jgi:hypothetical protein
MMRGSRIGWGAVAAACVVVAPAGATHHKAHAKETHHARATHHAATEHHAKTPAHHGKDARHGKDTRHAAREERKPAAVAGATSVPAGGIKLYCGPGRSPLMVRKMTQGSGTTVTVICR